MPDLASFQRAFARALLTDDQLAWPFQSPAFAVYRNTAAHGTVEALRAAFPTVDMLVGEEMFTQVALDFRHERPPASPILSDYGADFPDFLSRQPWTSELPYIADVARVDRLWLESFLAGAADTTTRSIDAPSMIRIHPAARFAWLKTPALTIWQSHRDGFDELEPEWSDEGVLFTRPDASVRVEAIDRATFKLLVGCASPVRADECVDQVAAAHPEADVPRILQRCVASGALIIH